ncbi:MAG: acyltransferase [Chloroflexota bacterium]|nr:acyltransferase [Chloroflexota bacterium]
MSDLASGAPRVNTQVARPTGWKGMLKPYVVAVLSAFWVRWYKLRLSNHVQFGRNFATNGRMVIRGPGRVIFGDDINAWANAEKNVFITYTAESRITVGSGSRLNGVGAMAYTQISFGPRCIVGSAIVVDNDFHPLEPAKRHDPTAPITAAPIKIGENVWLAGQCAVLKGVTVGDNSVVGFRAVVSGNVPANVVVAGNPARIVKRFDT